jgi:hypothetical protein
MTQRPSTYSDVQRRLRAANYAATPQQWQQEMRDMSQGGGGGGDPGPDGTQGAQKRHKKKKTRTVQRLIPAGYDTYPMNNQYVVASRADFGSWGIWGCLAVLLGPLILFSLGYIPLLPPVVMRYGFIQYMFLFPLYLWNMLLPKITDVAEFYQLALVLNVIAWADEIWLTVVLSYNFYACQVGIYDPVCRNNYPVDILMSVPTVGLFIIGAASVSKLMFVLARTSGTTPPSFIRATNY